MSTFVGGIGEILGDNKMLLLHRFLVRRYQIDEDNGCD